MILRKYEEIKTPINEVWSSIEYNNNISKSKMNICVSSKKLITNFNDTIDSMVLQAIGKYNNLNNFIVFGKNKIETAKFIL